MQERFRPSLVPQFVNLAPRVFFSPRANRLVVHRVKLGPSILLRALWPVPHALLGPPMLTRMGQPRVFLVPPGMTKVKLASPAPAGHAPLVASTMTSTPPRCVSRAAQVLISLHPVCLAPVTTKPVPGALPMLIWNPRRLVRLALSFRAFGFHLPPLGIRAPAPSLPVWQVPLITMPTDLPPVKLVPRVILYLPVAVARVHCLNVRTWMLLMMIMTRARLVILPLHVARRISWKV